MVAPMKNKSEGEHIRIYNNLHDKLVQKGFKPKLQKMVNEASKLLKEKIIQNDCQYQLAPPYNHKTNPAERHIQAFKAHFISVLCTIDQKFPIYLWDKLLPQADITINMLRQSNTHPQLSTYAHMNGQFDYNATPMAPTGTKAVIYQAKRPSFGVKEEDGWYIGPAM